MRLNDLHWYATAAFGLEGIVSAELKRLGMRDVQAESGGARFTGSPADAFRACLWLAQRGSCAADSCRTRSANLRGAFSAGEIHCVGGAASPGCTFPGDRKVRSQSVDERPRLSSHHKKGHCGASASCMACGLAAGDRRDLSAGRESARRCCANHAGHLRRGAEPPWLSHMERRSTLA